MIEAIKRFFNRDAVSSVTKLTDEEAEILKLLVDVDRPASEIATALDKSETRARYEISKLKREQDGKNTDI